MSWNNSHQKSGIYNLISDFKLWRKLKSWQFWNNVAASIKQLFLSFILSIWQSLINCFFPSTKPYKQCKITNKRQNKWNYYLPFNQWSGYGVIDIWLHRIEIKYIIVRECFIFTKNYLRVVRCNWCTHMTHINFFGSTLRTNPK